MSESTQTLGKYQIIREIARSNDIVYEAYDPLMNRRVALKELAMPGGLNDAQKLDRHNRFLREARAAGTLTHPNIVTVYEYGEDSGRNYIAMEFLDGHTLRNELDTHGFLPLDRSLDIGKAVLDALEYAHRNGVIHRDIKPENIQLMADGRIKITDFGIARLTFEPNLTMDGQVFGTPSYMSPEQVVGREIDARSDLFSLGVVMYEMISGRKPFQGDSVVSITYAIMNAEPSQPQQANYAVWQVLQHALDKSPALRYPSADEMKRALEEAEAASFSASMVLDPMMPVGSQPTGMFGMPPQQAYNPYGPQPQFQVGSAPPVGNPYVQMPYAQPYQPPFNPYQAPPPQAVGAPGFPNIPVYYPPPPRPPLITPEAKSVMTRLLVAFLIVGTIVTLAVVATNSFSTAWERMQTEKTASAAGSIQNPPSSGSIQNPKSKSQNSLSPQSAIRNPQSEISSVPNKPITEDPPNRGVSAPRVDNAEAQRLVDEAFKAMNEGRIADARLSLYEAKKHVEPGSEMDAQIQALIDQLTIPNGG